MIQKIELNSLMIVIETHNVSFRIILRMYLLTLMRFDGIKRTMSKQLYAFATKEPHLGADWYIRSMGEAGQLILLFFSLLGYI